MPSFAVHLRGLDELVAKLLQPLLKALALDHLEINGLYVLFGAIAAVLYPTTIVMLIFAWRAWKSGERLSPAAEGFLVWVGGWSLVWTVVGAILGAGWLLGF